MVPDYSQRKLPDPLTAGSFPRAVTEQPSSGSALAPKTECHAGTDFTGGPGHGREDGQERGTLVHFGSPAEIFGMDGLIILVVVALVLFGSTQIPKLARSLGSAKTEFKQGLSEGERTPPVEIVVPAVPASVAAAPAGVVSGDTSGARVTSVADAR
jgi:sec-independent protein translocase protein TatA